MRPVTLWASGVATLAFLGAGCTRTPDASKPATATASAPAAAVAAGDWNVILISIDTLRADHLGCYGHPFIRTPNIDRLAAEGTLFLECTSAAPITLPSHASILTGVNPDVHGARDNGTYHVHPDNVTLAEVLHDGGYATAGIVAALVLNREFGLAQGFDTYSDVTGNVARNEATLERMDRVADEVCDDALKRIGELAQAARPFFLFVHFYDPHQPYEPPARIAAQYNEKYVGEIAFVDEQLGRLFEWLRSSGLEQRTLVVFTADHGEGRGQHGEDTHATFLYDATLAVPLILRAPGRVPAGQRLSPQVRLIDIAPTIVDFLGFDALPQAQGTSLLPLVDGRRRDLDLAVYSESLYGMFSYGLAPLWSLRADGWKYIHAPKPELYHVAIDPGESHNLAEAEPQRLARMRGALRQSVAEAPRIVGAAEARHTVDAGTVAALQSLGYVGDATAPVTSAPAASDLELFEGGGPNPIDYIELVNLTATAVGFVNEHDPRAEATLRECLARAPNPDAGFAWAYSDLAKLTLDRGALDEAIAWYRRALAACPTDSRTMTALADTLAKRGELDEAIKVGELALQTPPVFAQTHAGLAAAFAAKGEVDRAREHFEAALKIDPDLTYVHRALGQMAARQDRYDDAVRHYERALKLVPDEPAWRAEFAQLLLARGAEAAQQYYQQRMQAQPADAAAAHAGLGDVLLLLERPDDAMREYRAALAAEATNAPAANALGLLLAERGAVAEAVRVMRTGLSGGGRHEQLANNLAWLLATANDAALRDGAEAVRLAESACRLTGRRNANFLDTLAAAYAEAGRYPEALTTVDEALGLVGAGHPLHGELTAHRALYAASQPCRVP